ncbi:hypothetical protein FJZ31_41035 [Candidatus Poribacteria bacterium]|nr:hypothetical protein [Candidatus Poribacteria bacterium]
MIRKNVTSYIILFLLLMALPIIANAQESKIITTKFQSKALSGNLLGISDSPNIYVYLPPSYESSGQSYPVVYLLHGCCMNAAQYWFTWKPIKPLVDQLISDGKVKEMIIVMPDAYISDYLLMYVNSPNGGNWGDYIAKELVEFIDKNFRTMPTSANRALQGYSMGGVGAWYLVHHYPDIFGCMTSHDGMMPATSNKEEWTTKYLVENNLKAFAKLRGIFID